jgi:hypothetical protein
MFFKLELFFFDIHLFNIKVFLHFTECLVRKIVIKLLIGYRNAIPLFKLLDHAIRLCNNDHMLLVAMHTCKPIGNKTYYGNQLYSGSSR